MKYRQLSVWGHNVRKTFWCGFGGRKEAWSKLPPAIPFCKKRLHNLSFWHYLFPSMFFDNFCQNMIYKTGFIGMFKKKLLNINKMSHFFAKNFILLLNFCLLYRTMVRFNFLHFLWSISTAMLFRFKNWWLAQKILFLFSLCLIFCLSFGFIFTRSHSW